MFIYLTNRKLHNGHTVVCVFLSFLCVLCVSSKLLCVSSKLLPYHNNLEDQGKDPTVCHSCDQRLSLITPILNIWQGQQLWCLFSSRNLAVRIYL